MKWTAAEKKELQAAKFPEAQAAGASSQQIGSRRVRPGEGKCPSASCGEVRIPCCLEVAAVRFNVTWSHVFQGLEQPPVPFSPSSRISAG